VFPWRRDLFVWEEEFLISLMEDLEGWWWKVEEGGIFRLNLVKRS